HSIEGACLLLAGLLSTGTVKEKYRAAIRASATEHAATFGRILAGAFGPKSGGTLADNIRAADWAGIEGMVPRLRRAAPLSALRRAPLSQLSLWARYLCQLTRKVLFPPGATIAIVGIDGSGKTTLAERLETRLRR